MAKEIKFNYDPRTWTPEPKETYWYIVDSVYDGGSGTSYNSFGEYYLSDLRKRNQFGLYKTKEHAQSMADFFKGQMDEFLKLK